MPQIQTVIHLIEQGASLRILKYALLVMGLLVMLITYNRREFKDMANQEAMDTAQLARNLAEGKGYNTLFVRPFSVYLIQQAYAAKHGPTPLGDVTDRSQIRIQHPDIANAPVYPVLLAGLMKIAPDVRWQKAGVTKAKPGEKHINIWNNGGAFWIYPPDFWIGLFNQVFFMAIAVLLFVLANWLFDSRVAWTASALFVGTDLFWRFSMSGLSTMLVMLLLMLLAGGLAVLERKARENQMSALGQFLLAAGIGAVAGLGCLTRYSFGWLILPVLLFAALFLGQRRIYLCLIILGVFVAIVSPWVVRNFHLSHTPFGTAGYAMYEHTAYFPENRLQRSLDPDLSRVSFFQVWGKLIGNTRVILQEDLPKLGGNWLNAFFLVGLFINYTSASRARLRYFVLFCLPVLIAAQALGRTQLTNDSPVVNSENLLVLLAPLVIMFGVSLFYSLLDQVNLPAPQLRYVLIGAFCFVVCLPALFNFVSPRTSAIAYPPYYPPIIQKVSGWMKPDELMMSDVPWAVAWYGERQCMWITLNAQTDFFNVYDYQKPIKAVYLTPLTMDGRFLSQWFRAGEHSWGSFALETMMKKELPPYFPLKHVPVGFLPEQLFLTDSDRWATVETH